MTDLNLFEILTGQEHELYGSTASVNKQVVEMVEAQPYTPVAFLVGNATLDQVAEARTAAGTYKPMLNLGFAEWRGQKLGLTGYELTLEPLDKEGNTVRDPRPIINGKPIDDAAVADNFPYRRE